MPLMEQLKRHLGNILTLCTLFALIALIAVILLTTPPLTKSGPLSSAKHTVLVLVVTVAGTIFSSLIASRIRHLMLQLVDIKLQRSVNLSGGVANTLVAFTPIDRRWRGILAIDSTSEKLHNLPIVFIYLFCALMTTAIVTTFTPVTFIRKISYHPLVPDANYESEKTCAYMVDGSFSDPRPYSWSLSNGSHFFVPANAGGCPTRFAEILSGNINPISPQTFAYSDMGVAVEASAVAAPVSIYSSQPNGSPALEALLQSYGTFLLNTTQCVPVMHKNPMQCQPGGTLQYGGYATIGNADLYYQQVTVISADDSCNISSLFPLPSNQNVTSANLMLNSFCPANGNNSIGKGTMVLAGNAAYGFWLASFMDDLNGNVRVTPGYSYAVTCTVDASDVFSYRRVTLSLQGSNNAFNTSFARTLSSSGEQCDPVQPTISNILFATAAAANWQLLSQNMGIDGLTDSLGQATGNWRKPPYAFPNSRNPLEDSLGLVAALVISRVNNSGRYVPAEESAGEYAYVQATRLGTGKREALLLLVPPVATAIIFLVLMIMGFKDELSHCDSRISPPCDDKEDLRPHTESLQRLIRLGTFMGS